MPKNKQTLLSRVTKALNEADSVILGPQGKPMKKDTRPGRSVNPELLKRFQDRKTPKIKYKRAEHPLESKPGIPPKLRKGLGPMKGSKGFKNPKFRSVTGRRPLTGFKGAEERARVKAMPLGAKIRYKLGKGREKYGEFERGREDAVAAQAKQRLSGLDPKAQSKGVRHYMAGRALTRHQRRAGIRTRLKNAISKGQVSKLNIRGF